MPKKQHKTPCAKCPFRRDSLQSWLGGETPEYFAQIAQSETRMPCHTHADRDGVDYGDSDTNKDLPQCAGRAIFWSNQIKMQRPGSNLLELPKDHVLVFSRQSEFVSHHNSTPTPKHDRCARCPTCGSTTPCVKRVASCTHPFHD